LAGDWSFFLRESMLEISFKPSSVDRGLADRAVEGAIDNPGSQRARG
jgi:hypothetical protein